MRAHVEAYGCTLNFGEAKEIAELLSSRGWQLVNSPDEADLVIIATCVVVAKTERAMLKRIEALSDAPRLIITGCLATTYRDKASVLAPGAEFVAPADRSSLSSLIETVGPERSVGSENACSIIPVATGCRGQCAYCITKVARGDLRSRPVNDILGSVKAALKYGPTEVQLAAQDTACYGSDIGTSLPILVSKVCALPGEFRVRVGMMNPRSAAAVPEGVAGMYRGDKVFKFLHLPVQSGSDRILEMMGRGYRARDFFRILEDVRSEAPELSLSTDLIVGYPGETDDDHEASMELVRVAQPDIVNVTRFSSRPGTEAAEAPDAVAGAVAKERSRHLAKLRFDVALKRNREWIGRQARCLATERGKSRSTILRTDEYRQVVVREELPLREFYDVVVDDATKTYLIGSRTG